MPETVATKPEPRKIEPIGAGQTQVFPLFEPGEFAKLGARNMEFMSRAARACFSGATEMNREFAEFINQRVRKDFEAARQMMALKNGEDAFSMQATFVEEAIRDYAEGTTKAFNIAAEIAHQALRPAEQEKKPD